MKTHELKDNKLYTAKISLTNAQKTLEEMSQFAIPEGNIFQITLQGNISYTEGLYNILFSREPTIQSTTISINALQEPSQKVSKHLNEFTKTFQQIYSPSSLFSLSNNIQSKNPQELETIGENGFPQKILKYNFPFTLDEITYLVKRWPEATRKGIHRESEGTIYATNIKYNNLTKKLIQDSKLLEKIPEGCLEIKIQE